MKLDGTKVCPRECPNRSAECRLTCADWKAFEAEKQKAYAAKAVAISSYPNSMRKARCMRKNVRENLRRRK